MTKKEETGLNEKEMNDLYDLKLLYPLYGLKNALQKLHKNEEPTEEEVATVVKFVDTFSTVSLHPAIVGHIVSDIAKKVNQHHHTKTCRKYNTVCRFKMPKLPSKETIIARPPGQNMTDNKKKITETKHATVIMKVREVLNNKEEMDSIYAQYPKDSETTMIEATEGRLNRIDAVLDKAGLITEDDKKMYNEALTYNSSGFTVVMARDIDELYTNSYNPEITRAWNGNTDFQICLDFYAIITYITEYYAKDDTGLVKHLVDTLKASESTELKEQMKILMNTWVKNRQMGEAEAVYRLTKEFHFRESDAKCVFVQTCPRKERSKILKNVTGKDEYKNIPKVTVENHKEGEYIENYDINSKYERRPRQDHPDLEHLSLSQMVKMYRPSWGKKSDKDNDKYENEEENEARVFDHETDLEGSIVETLTLCGQSQAEMVKQKDGQLNRNRNSGHDITCNCASGCGTKRCNCFKAGRKCQDKCHKRSKKQVVCLNIEVENDNVLERENEVDDIYYGDDGPSSDEKFHRVMAYVWEEGRGPKLPEMFKLIDPYPGEPPFMALRRSPAVLRLHKYKESNDPEGYWFSEAMLYLPYEDEEDLVKKIDEAKAGGSEAWELFVKKIKHVKSQVMEFLDGNEEARIMAADMVINNNMTGEFMDPEGEQENEENRLEDFVQQEDLAHLDPEYVEPPEGVFEKEFRPIEVRPLNVLREHTRNLDFYQRKVMEIGVRYAKGLVKSRSGRNPLPTPPRVMVDGAAGAGKSCTINILKEIIQLIMQKPGDNPECPYILLCAPTGTAAINIKGQTLHSAFGFTFGDEHYSLSDKTRDTKRAKFKNLRFIIIDEISMVKSDQLYQLDLRLREITMRPNEVFGGVALFFFGDIMQLKPVLGRYIWMQPRSIEYVPAFLVQSLWEDFSVISLVENHRQQGDAEYANILNRIRLGEHTDDDVKVLEERVRPEGHPDMKGAQVIASTHAVVNKYNELYLKDLQTPVLKIEAINSHNNIPNYKPKIHPKKNTVGPTPYLQTLCLKPGCRVMLTVNLNVPDSLSNGSIGTLKGVIKEGRGNAEPRAGN